MEIWKATREDIPALMPYAQEFHRRGIFSAKPFDHASTERYLADLMSSGHARVYMHAKGCIGMSVERAEMNSGWILRERFFMARDKSGAPLLAAFEAFGLQMKVDCMSMSMQAVDNALPPKLVEYYRTNGFIMAEAAFVKTL